MGKGKLHKFAELKTFHNVFQPDSREAFNGNFFLKGNWNKQYFHNLNGIILELGCGKGDYTTRLAELYPAWNFIGVDIKGARIWTGARYALDKDLKNVAFIRTRIELIDSFFDRDEISEIWLTFPDPQIKRRRNKKRLTGSRFLKLYQKFLIDGGIIHLKTDNRDLFEYTLKIIQHNHLSLIHNSEDLYSSDIQGAASGIRTYYENRFLEQGFKICYLSFRLNSEKEIEEPEI